MTATSSDAESLREQIATAFREAVHASIHDECGEAWVESDVGADALIAAVPALQPASSDLRAAVEALRIEPITDDAEFAAHDIAWNDAIDDVLRLLDTAQPDLRRTPEAGIDVDELLRILDDAAIQGVVGARLLYAKLAATPAPAQKPR